jgi:hypothetical protein
VRSRSVAKWRSANRAVPREHDQMSDEEQESTPARSWRSRVPGPLRHGLTIFLALVRSLGRNLRRTSQFAPLRPIDDNPKVTLRSSVSDSG